MEQFCASRLRVEQRAVHLEAAASQTIITAGVLAVLADAQVAEGPAARIDGPRADLERLRRQGLVAVVPADLLPVLRPRVGGLALQRSVPHRGTGAVAQAVVRRHHGPLRAQVHAHPRVRVAVGEAVAVVAAPDELVR